MYYEEDAGVSKFVTGMLVGAVLGAGIALLTAPNSGRATRTRLVRVVRRSHGQEEDGYGDGDGYADGYADGADADVDADADMDREQVLRELKRRHRKARR